MMSSKSVLAALASFILITQFLCMANCIPTTKENENVQACGRELADLLQKICQYSGYNTYHRTDQDYGRRKKRSITKECCFQPCTRFNLSLYCDYNPVAMTPISSTENNEKNAIEVKETESNRCNNTDENNSIKIIDEKFQFLSIDNEINNNKIHGSRKDVENEIIKTDITDLLTNMKSKNVPNLQVTRNELLKMEKKKWEKFQFYPNFLSFYNYFLNNAAFVMHRKLILGILE